MLPDLWLTNNTWRWIMEHTTSLVSQVCQATCMVCRPDWDNGSLCTVMRHDRSYRPNCDFDATSIHSNVQSSLVKSQVIIRSRRALHGKARCAYWENNAHEWNRRLSDARILPFHPCPISLQILRDWHVNLLGFLRTQAAKKHKQTVKGKIFFGKAKMTCPWHIKKNVSVVFSNSCLRSANHGQ